MSFLNHHSFAKDNYCYLFCAAISAQAIHGEKGFRQRDVGFFVELFMNWSRADSPQSSEPVHKTQIQRWIKVLVAMKWIGVRRRSRPPKYQFTSSGLIEGIDHLIEAIDDLAIEELFFVLYFVSSYGERIQALLNRTGDTRNLLNRLEINRRFDFKFVRSRALDAFRSRQDRLRARAQEAQEMGKAAQTLKLKGTSSDEIAMELMNQFGYQLNAVRPLTHLIGQLPEDLQSWELIQANFERSQKLWEPMAGLMGAISKLIEKFGER